MEKRKRYVRGILENKVNLQRIKRLACRLLIDGNENISISFEEYQKYHGRSGHYLVKLFKMIQLNWKYRICHSELDDSLAKLRMPEYSSMQLPSQRELIDELKNYDIISFDIFDTLIFRCVSEPRDVFRLLESEWHILHFAEKRVQAEAKARERMGEATIYDIYEILSKELNIDIEQAIEKEFDIENKVCFANPYMKFIFDELNENKQVVLTSDMYLTKQMLQELLCKCGYSVKEDQIFVSCELGVGKENGRLQNLVSQAFGCSKTYIHVGDNRNNDILGSKKAGWNTFFYPNVGIGGAPYRRKEMQTLASSFYKGIVNAKLHSGVAVQDAYYEYGYCYGGILAVGYYQFLRRLVVTEQIGQLLFLARDGYIIKKIYDRFAGDVDSEYIPFSRFASYQLTIERTWKEMLEQVVKPRLNIRPLECVGAVLEISDLLFLDRYLEVYGISKQDTFSPEIYNAIEQIFEKNINEIEKNYQDTVAAAQEYFMSHVKPNQKILIVDVGWQGTGAICLKYFLEKKCDLHVQVYGALMGMVNNDSAEICVANRSLFSYLYSPHHNRMTYLRHARKPSQIPYRDMLVEILFTENHPSFLKFELDKDGNVVLKYCEKENNGKMIDSMQCGIMDFADEYLTYEKQFGDVLEICGQEAYIPLDSMARAKKLCTGLLGDYEIHATPGMFDNEQKQTYREAQKY